MSVIFCLVNLGIVVYGNQVFENKQRKYVDNIFTLLTAGGLNITERENTKQTSPKLHGNITDEVFEHLLESKTEPVTDFKKGELHGGNVNKTSLSTRNEDVEMDDTILSTFDEKARHDGFKRSSPEDYPYAVIVYVEFYNDLTWTIVGSVCSGSLLTSRWVLTAAHCLDHSINKVLVIAGAKYLKEVELRYKPASLQVRVAHMYHKHPGYDNTQKTEYDVAVVKADEAFKMTSAVNTVKMGKIGWSHDNYKACMFTGFGSVYLDTEDPQDSTRKTHYFEVKDSCPCLTELGLKVVMCSRLREDYGLCTGDSGGGLVCDGVVVAVASFLVSVSDTDSCDDFEKAKDCGLNSTLSVFQKVEPYLGWIHSKTGRASRSSYQFIVVVAIILSTVYRTFL